VDTKYGILFIYYYRYLMMVMTINKFKNFKNLVAIITVNDIMTFFKIKKKIEKRLTNLNSI